MEKTNKSKKWYDKPMLMVEEFVANQYVATCNSVTDLKVTCARPGSDGNKLDGTAYGTSYQASIERYCSKHNANEYHGICGDPSEIFLDGSGNGTENNGRPITGLIIGGENTNGSYSKVSVNLTSFAELVRGKIYSASWTSTDNNGCSYAHYGSLKVSGYSHS